MEPFLLPQMMATASRCSWLLEKSWRRTGGSIGVEEDSRWPGVEKVVGNSKHESVVGMVWISVTKQESGWLVG